MEAHWHYRVLAANAFINGQYLESATIIVIAQTEQESLEKAKTAIKKELYIVLEAQECLEAHGVAADMSMLQLEIQKRLLDLSRGKN
jgi:hypothetical protein